MSDSSRDSESGFRWTPGFYILASFLLGLLLAAPLLFFGAPDLSNDALDHARWAANFGAQFWAGDFYPRWLTNVNLGFGSPAMFFYPPFASFAAAIFWPFMHRGDPHGWLMAGYSCALASATAGVSSFLWLRTMVARNAAFFGAFIYMIAPYHLAIDLYNRGAAAEFWVMAWMPLVMFACYRITAGKAFAVPGLALAYGLAVLSHPTVALCFGALPVVYALVQSDSGKKIRAALLTVGGLALGAGLNSLFLLPALFDQPKSYASMQVNGWGDYRNWWLFQVRGSVTDAGTAGSGIPWYFSYKMRILVISLWTLGFVCALWWLVVKQRASPFARRMAGFYACTAIAATFLMTKQSALLWEYLPNLRFLQYPNRLGTVLALCAGALAALGFSHLRGRGTYFATGLVAVTVLGWMAADAAAASQAFSHWRHVPADRLVRSDELTRAQIEYFSFWPRPANMDELSVPAALDRFARQHPPGTVSFAENGQGSVRVESWQPRRILARVSLPVSRSVVVNHFYYEGWHARVVGSSSPISVNPSKGDGLIALNAPAGDYELVVELPPDPSEKAGLILSAISLAITLTLVAAAVLTMRRDRKEVPQKPAAVLPE